MIIRLLKAVSRHLKAKKYARSCGFRVTSRFQSWIYEKNNLKLAIGLDGFIVNNEARIILSDIYVQYGNDIGEYGYKIEEMGNMHIKEMKRYLEIDGYEVKIYNNLGDVNAIRL